MAKLVLDVGRVLPRVHQVDGDQVSKNVRVTAVHGQVSGVGVAPEDADCASMMELSPLVITCNRLR